MRTVRVAGEHGAGCVRAHSSSLRSSRYFAPPLPIVRRRSVTGEVISSMYAVAYKLQLEEPELSPLVDPESSRSRWTPGEG